jgi:DNA polymerase V
VKRLLIKKGKLWLQPENSEFKAIEVTNENEFVIWGIVTNVIKKV